MSERQERLQNRLQPEIREFRDGCRTLQLATVDGEGNPNASYAPFVLQEDGYYVLISEIARHARNLQQVPKVSLMLIEDETGARELFARKRLTFDAVAEVVARDDERWSQAIAALEGRFGDIVKGLSNLKDFVLFRLKPEPFEIAVASARAQLENARNQILYLKASYNQSLAEIAQAEAKLPFYHTNL